MKKTNQLFTSVHAASSIRSLSHWLQRRRSDYRLRAFTARAMVWAIGIAVAGMCTPPRAEDWPLLMDSDPALITAFEERAVLAPTAKMWRTALQYTTDTEWTANTCTDIIKAAKSGTDPAAMREILQPALRGAFERETRSAVRLNLANAILALKDYGLANEFAALGQQDIGKAL